MQHAHERGVIHGNLEPASVLLDGVENVKIIEVGLVNQPHPTDHTADNITPEVKVDPGFRATLASRGIVEVEGADQPDPEEDGSGGFSPGVKADRGFRATLQESLGWVGNVRYLAPEIVGFGRITLSVDIYGLGAILYRLLTGRPPFDCGSLPELIARVQREPPTPLSQLRPEVPAALEWLCLKCLEKNAAHRPPSAGKVADDLDQFLAHQSGLAEHEQTTTVYGERAGPEHERISGYEYLEVVARKALGTVYKARHLTTGRIVALKLLPTSLPGSYQEYRALRRQVEVLAKLNHPGIVRLHEYGEQNGMFYIATDFAADGDLARLLNGGPLPIRTAVRLLEEIAGIVGHIHTQQIVHYDLKPSHILFSRGEGSGTVELGTDRNRYQPKITDFGLAASYREESIPLSTTAPKIMGTPAYMAPQRLTAGEEEAGSAEDVWSLGVILYEVLTGRRPFSGSSRTEVFSQILRLGVTPPRRLRAEIPAAVEAVCLKCLQREPESRYPTASELADALRCVREGEFGRWHVRWVRRLWGAR
jgi:serine/threonine protein kinase